MTQLWLQFAVPLLALALPAIVAQISKSTCESNDEMCLLGGAFFVAEGFKIRTTERVVNRQDTSVEVHRSARELHIHARTHDSVRVAAMEPCAAPCATPMLCPALYAMQARVPPPERSYKRDPELIVSYEFSGNLEAENERSAASPCPCCDVVCLSRTA